MEGWRGPLLVERSGRVGEELEHGHEDGESDHLSQDANREGDALNDEVADVEAVRLGQRRGQGTEDGTGVFGDGLDRRDGRSGDGCYQEDLDQLEPVVCVLGEEFDAGVRGLARELGAEAHDDGDQRHENGQGDTGKQAGHDAHDDIGDLLEPGQEGHLLEVGHLRDDTDKGDGDGPEDDEGGDEGDDGVSPDDLLPPRDTEGLPDDLGGLDSDVLGRHLKGLVMGRDLERGLSIRLGVKLGEDSGDLLVLPGTVVGLGSIDGGDQALKLGAAPFDCVDLSADETQQAEAVGRTLLLGDPASSGIARLGVLGGRGLVGRCAVLDSLEARGVGELDKLDLGLFELHGNLVALLDELVELLGVAGDPDPLDRLAEELLELGLVQVGVGDRSEENCARRDALGVGRGEQEGLAQVDVEDALAHDEVHDEAVEEPTDEGVGVQAVKAGGDGHVDVAVRQDVKLLGRSSARSIDGKQDGPGHDEADQADGGADTEEAKKEIGVEGLVLESVYVGDLPETGDGAARLIAESLTPIVLAALEIVEGRHGDEQAD
ncbi:hypothetical protein ColKHC_09600 [Colletotrichum higginsianum]|nr:hypothetical protein ColKHC_09600 [Colletotrichum higginsianum]